MKHLAIIQIEFLKQARNWDNLSLENQRRYLKRHPKSKRKLTSKKNNVHDLANKFVDLHNHAAKEYKNAFANAGAKMWHDDDAHSLNSDHSKFIENQLQDNIKYINVLNIKRPLTVLDSFPNIRRNMSKMSKLDKSIDEIYNRYSRLWSIEKKRVKL